MKRLFIAILLMLLLAALLAAAIASEPGYILLAFGHYTLETTAWVGLALLFATLLVMYLAVVLLHHGLRRVGMVGRWRVERRVHRDQQLMTRGVVALIEGNPTRARRLLERAALNSKTPLVSQLLAARASAELGDGVAVEMNLRRAEQGRPRAIRAVLLTRAELALKAGQPQSALATLERLGRDAHRLPRALELQRDALLQLGDWERLLVLLPELRRHLKPTVDELEALELRTGTALLDAAATQGVDALRERWQALPKPLRRLPALIAHHATLLLQAGAHGDAESLLIDALKRQWEPALVELYGRTQGGDARRQLARAEGWLDAHGDEPTLQRCLARLALRNQLWGQARDHYETAMRLFITAANGVSAAATGAELGQLLQQLGEHDAAARCFRQSLAAALPPPPELPLPGGKLAAPQ
jgi:HemY protein